MLWSMTQAPTCVGCGGALLGRADQRFCSSACRQAAYRQRRRWDRVEQEGERALAWFAARLFGSRNADPSNSRNGEGR
jgi:predicted nucleic acid-binding Zn ribbon protein